MTDANYFRTFGFLVLRQFFDPDPLAAEIDRVLGDGLVSSPDVSRHDGRFQFVPMMTMSTPQSLMLLDRTQVVASTLLRGPVLSTRAKAVRYFGNTDWHVDSAFPISSVGFAAYLEPLTAENGALRVLPGSHQPEFGNAVRALGSIGMTATALPSHGITTEPGDMIIFDEHLFHASSGGETRRQWRIDYISDPENAELIRQTVAYFEGIFTADWDGGYDVERYASYGPEWRASGRSPRSPRRVRSSSCTGIIHASKSKDLRSPV